MGRYRLSYRFVKSEFEKEGYELISKSYTNNKTKLKYRCPSGHTHSINWNNWKSGYRCPYCSNQLVYADNCLMITHPDISKEMHPTKNKDLTAYIITHGSKKNIWWICSKEHEWLSTVNNRIHGNGCPHCYGNTKHTYEFVKEQFENEGYELLSREYTNSKQKLIYVCPAGHRHAIDWDHWKQGQRCRICAYINHIGDGNPNYGNGIKITGDKNPSWKGGVSCEPYCDAWADKEYKESIKERDRYECQNPYCWGTSDILDIHHIDYNKKNCKPENLITVCRSCNARANKNRKYHTEFYRNLIIEKESV